MRFESRVLETVQRTYDVRSFRFERPKGFEFAPGQYMYVTLKRDGKELEKHFTISSSPTETSYIELTKRLTGHEYSNALVALKPGDAVTIDAPHGDFTFSGEYDRVAMLTWGIGITPLRSMIRYATDKGLTTDITLLYSNHSDDDIPFADELEEMARRNANLKVVNTISSPSAKWNGHVGRIDGEMVRREMPDYSNRVAYVSGPYKMVNDVTNMLRKELKMPKNRLKKEDFPGYD
jgi:ferredoxin-NADP reductase